MNEDIILVDVTLDDSQAKRYTQWMSNLTELTYQEITTRGDKTAPKHLENEALIQAADKLIDNWIDSDRLIPYCSNESDYLESIDQTVSLSMRDFSNIFQKMKELRKRFPNKKIVFCIDAWNNMKLSHKRKQ